MLIQPVVLPRLELTGAAAMLDTGFGTPVLGEGLPHVLGGSSCLQIFLARLSSKYFAVPTKDWSEGAFLSF